MTTYQVSGVLIDSDIELPLPREVTAEPPALAVRALTDVAPRLFDGELVGSQADGRGGTIYTLLASESHYLWSYPAIGDFLLSRDGKRVHWRASGPDRRDVIAALTGPVIGLALQLQGVVLLHGSAVVSGDVALGFLAPSGFGKSTLALTLVRRGCSLLSDDVIPVEVGSSATIALPSYPRVKLWPDGLERLLPETDWQQLPSHVSWLDKRVFDADCAGAVCSDPRPLGGLFLLIPTQAGTLRIERMVGSEALLALVGHGYHAELLEREPAILSHQMDVLHRVAEATPVFSLVFPHGFDHLEAVADAVLSLPLPASAAAALT